MLSLRLSALVVLLPAMSACSGPQQMFAVGDCALESGEVIHDCRVGYRVFGQLNPSRTNAVLVTPWLLGTSAELASQFGPGKLVDTSQYFVIAVDALGNGVSSSPSNSRLQPGASFPKFSLRDVVESQYQLVTRHLRLDHLRAVVGISMGGMQAWVWATEHPGLMDKAISVLGSPRSDADDRRRWAARIEEARSGSRWKKSLGTLGKRAPFDAWRELRIDDDDFTRQAQAIMALDVSKSHGGSMEAAAAAVRARVLVVTTARDEVVSPGPARDFAKLTGARLVELPDRCGHQSSSCERQRLWAEVAQFLEQ